VIAEAERKNIRPLLVLIIFGIFMKKRTDRQIRQQRNSVACIIVIIRHAAAIRVALSRTFIIDLSS